MARGKKNTPEMISRLVDIGKEHLIQLGLSDADSAAVMRKIAHDLCKRYGGGPMYVPRDKDFEAAERDERIWQEFNGTNVIELSQKHELSEQMIYIIVRDQRAMHLKKTQVGLPGFDDQDG